MTRCGWPLALAVFAALTPEPGCDSSGTHPPNPCVLTAPAPPDWRLVTDGTKLRDGLGRVVFLHGVDAGGRSKFAPYVPFDYAPGQYQQALGAYLDRAASWGIDALRVPFTWAALEPTQGHDDADWLSRYQALLDGAWARGIWTVVDFHQDVYSEAYCGDGFPTWTIPNAPAPHHDCPGWSFEYFQDKDVQAAFDAFWAAGSPVQAQYLAAWDRMIARFKDEPGVVGFEPLNEPGWGSAADIEGFEATTLSDFFARVVPHFNAAAPQALVFVEPTGYAGSIEVSGLKQPPGSGVVFAPHFYPIGKGDPDSVPPAMQKWADVGTQWNVPVFVGEFGTSYGVAGGLDFMTAIFGALDTMGLHGTEWEYSVESEEWNSETDSVVAGDGTEHAIAGALVRPFARAVAGDSIAQSWDGASGTFTLSYVPSESGTTVSEVQMPARAYPGGLSVSLSNGCYDATSVPGRMLVQVDPSAGPVTLVVTPKTAPAADAGAE